MKQLTDEQIEEMARQEQLLLVCDDLEALTEIVRATERALAALDTAQPVPEVNAMLVEALEANHKWHQDYDDHGGYPESDLCEQNEAAITAAKQAQPERAPLSDDQIEACLPSGIYDGTKEPWEDVLRITRAVEAAHDIGQEQRPPTTEKPKRIGLTDSEIMELFKHHLRVSDVDGYSIHGAWEFARAIEAAHGIKQGGQQ